jgi:hypothetical protein
MIYALMSIRQNQTSSQSQQSVHETETKQVPDTVDENIDYKKGYLKNTH